MLSRRVVSRSFSTSKFYDLLKISKSATDEEIKKAYKKSALEHHPDRGGDSDKFKEISHAYSVLSDPAKRQVYDQFGEQGLDGNMGPGNRPGGYYEDPMDIFSQVFGGAARRNGSRGGMMRGRDAVYKLELTLEEIAKGTNRTIAYNRDVACASCSGRGATKIDTCKRCGGSGVVLSRQNIGFMVHMQTPCPDCGGEGYKVPRDGHCKPCKGGGIVQQKEVFSVSIPAGCPIDHQFKFLGKADQLPGHTAGDVIVQVKTKQHSVFTRMWDRSPDLVMKKEISLADALAGTSFEIESLTGEKVTVSQGSNVVAPGDVWVARGLGLLRFEGTTKGDLFVQFTVKFPGDLSELSSDDKEKLSRIFSGEPAKNKGCLSKLFEQVTTNAEEEIVDSKSAHILEKINNNEIKQQINSLFEAPKESSRQRTQQQFYQQGVDPQQCQQQ